VTVAALPAFGVAWYTLRRWLENFAYRAEMNYLLFALVLAFTLLLTFGVTGLHAFRTARLPTNLIQAQRDYFGAHTYERVDKPAGQFFHFDWLS